MKTHLPLLLLAAFFTTTALAQEPAKPVKTGNEWKMPADVFRRSEAYAARLKATLSLDSAQTKKVYDAYLANIKPVDEISVLPDGEEKKAKMKANQAAFDDTLKNILTPDQFHKYLQKVSDGHYSPKKTMD